MTGGKRVPGAAVIIFALTRSVRYMVRIDANGTGDPSPTVMYDYAPMYR